MPICIKCGSDKIKAYEDDSGKCSYCGKAYYNVRGLPNDLSMEERQILKNKVDEAEREKSLCKEMNKSTRTRKSEHPKRIMMTQTKIPWVTINAIILGIILYIVGMFYILLTPIPTPPIHEPSDSQQGYLNKVEDYSKKMGNYFNITGVGSNLKDIGFVLSSIGCVLGFYQYGTREPNENELESEIDTSEYYGYASNGECFCRKCHFKTENLDELTKHINDYHLKNEGS